MATLDQSKDKIKGISKGENLFEALVDGIFDTISKHFQERSAILIETIEAVNIGTQENPKILHPATSLLGQERKDYNDFFKRRKINFTWSYIDMLGLDLDLIMHHLNVGPGAKPVKQKLEKIHPHIALLVKTELKKLLDVGFI